MTAGHCFEPSAAVYAGRSNPDVTGYLLGYVSARKFSGNADAEAIRWTTGDTAYNYLSNCVYVYSSDCQRMTVGGGGYTGMAVQKSGITTGLTSGSLTNFSMSINVADDNGTVVALTDMIQTTACAIPGDSGGPLFSGSELLGITSAVGGLDSSGNCASTTRSYFDKLGNGNAAIGFYPRFTE
jgi:streptogrisin D